MILAAPATPFSTAGVRTWWRDDGMLQLMAVLPREDGAVVVAALEAAAHLVATEQRHVPSPDQPELAAEHRTHPMLRADALFRLCETWIVADATVPVVAPTTQVVVHVDADALSGNFTGGRSHIENGPWLSPAAARWLSCDADVVTVTERDGLPPAMAVRRTAGSTPCRRSRTPVSLCVPPARRQERVRRSLAAARRS